jgi:hypothetical protein
MPPGYLPFDPKTQWTDKEQQIPCSRNPKRGPQKGLFSSFEKLEKSKGKTSLSVLGRSVVLSGLCSNGKRLRSPSAFTHHDVDFDAAAKTTKTPGKEIKLDILDPQWSATRRGGP